MKSLKNFTLWSILIGLLVFSVSCKDEANKKPNKDSLNTDSLNESYERKVLEKTKNANIYEVNIRQYTPEGTFKAFEKHIPRLDEMGVDILWLMPIFPISEKNRKGTLGSYYAVADYKKVNPEFGSEEDLKSLIKTAHENDMLVILDWVANHTGWDNPWIEKHPEWYTTDSTGNIIVPEGTDWSDVADLNYDNKEMRAAMKDALEYWVREFDTDGYRCDVAGMVPTDFWNDVRPALEKIKPVFMLAEAEQADLHETAFDMGYAWDLHHIMNKIAAGEKNAQAIAAHYKEQQEKFPPDVYHMVFTSNHDENSWNGTVFERMPNSYKTWAVFSFVYPGMPLIYNGQEVGLDKRLEFFEKDEIEWKEEHELTDLYSKLIDLKNENKALWNGEYGGEMQVLQNELPEQVLSFKREKDGNTVVAVLNLSDEKASFKVSDMPEAKAENYFKGEDAKLSPEKEFDLKAWEYRIFTIN